MILSARTGTIFIDPYAHGDREYYTVYFKKDYRRSGPQEPFSCATDDEHFAEGKKEEKKGEGCVVES